MDFTTRLNTICQRIAAASARATRDPASITLLAVSKTHPPETIQAAVEAGQLLFGENKIQEAKAKIPLCPSRARWQFIGHLQSNKVRDAVQLFDLIQGVDSLAIAREISKRGEHAAKTVPILLEVNVAGEGTKFGFRPDLLLAELAEIHALPRLEIHGLMAIPPYAAVPETARPYFRRLRELRMECQNLISVPLPHLSMGMSEDFEIAIEEGATMVRIGTALFGTRASVIKRAEEI